MPKSKNPESKIIDYFENAPYEAARAVHAIAKRILAKRVPQRLLDDVRDGGTRLKRINKVVTKEKPEVNGGEPIDLSNPSYRS